MVIAPAQCVEPYLLLVMCVAVVVSVLTTEWLARGPVDVAARGECSVLWRDLRGSMYMQQYVGSAVAMQAPKIRLEGMLCLPGGASMVAETYADDAHLASPDGRGQH